MSASSTTAGVVAVAETVPSGEGTSASEAGGLLLRGGIVGKGCVGVGHRSGCVVGVGMCEGVGEGVGAPTIVVPRP